MVRKTTKTVRKSVKSSAKKAVKKTNVRKSTSARYILRITTVTKTTPADRVTVSKLKAHVQAELRRRGAKNVKVEAVRV